MFSIEATRAPGPYGLTASFYQKQWDIVGSAIIEEVTKFFDTEELSPDLNHTNLCIITKINHPVTMIDFRSSSLQRYLHGYIKELG